MKVRVRKNYNLYRQQQTGGNYPVFRGKRRFQRGAGFGSFFKGLGKTLFKHIKPVAKRVVKHVGPKLYAAAVETGADVISGKKNLKQAVKDSAIKQRKALVKDLKKIIAPPKKKKQKGGSLMRKKKIGVRRSKKSDIFS